MEEEHEKDELEVEEEDEEDEDVEMDNDDKFNDMSWLNDADCLTPIAGARSSDGGRSVLKVTCAAEGSFAWHSVSEPGAGGKGREAAEEE